MALHQVFPKYSSKDFRHFQLVSIADELLHHLIRHPPSDEFRQRVFDDLFLVIGQQLVDLIHDFQLITKLVTYLVNIPLTFFIKL